ncbi:MAG TPA: hypothetical protein VJQ79_12115 [Acidimicrobiia bacterium]|nr:hypothetical protein [Acidimicrobiia bacterium]
MNRSLRSRVLAVVVAAILVVPVLSASAAEGDLASYFERAAAAEFSGDQVLACNTPVGLRDTAAHLAQKDGVLYITAGVDGAPAVSAGAGLLAITGPAGSATAVQVVAAAEPPVGYQISGTRAVTFLGRSADELTLRTGGKARVRLTFDQGTGVLLRSETLNSDGSVYCTTSMTSFVSSTPKVLSGSSGDVRKLQKDTDFPAEAFPDRIGTFRRLDVYGWNHDGEMGYYSDGFFAFALYHIPGQFSVTNIPDARTWTGDLGKYSRWFRPGTVTFVWDTADGGMALHGDLPVDLQATVLAGLPAPSRPSFFDRILSLFS